MRASTGAAIHTHRQRHTHTQRTRPKCNKISLTFCGKACQSSVPSAQRLSSRECHLHRDTTTLLHGGSSWRRALYSENSVCVPTKYLLSTCCFRWKLLTSYVACDAHSQGTVSPLRVDLAASFAHTLPEDEVSRTLHVSCASFTHMHPTCYSALSSMVSSAHLVSGSAGLV